MNLLPDFIKKGLVRLDLLTETLHRLELLRYEDRVRLRAPLYHAPVLLEEEGQHSIAVSLAQNKPLLVARLGSVELACLGSFLRRRQSGAKGYPKKIRYWMGNNAGFFPTDDASLDALARLYLERLSQVDVLAVWFNRYEDVICNSYCGSARLVELGCLESFRFAHPWSAQLSGKKVLVIHPFAASIERQYRENRRRLFANPEVLPEFELKTLQAVQSSAGATVAFSSWFDAYRHMCDEMTGIDFDVCLVGAGAYGLPLAAFAKEMGKQAIHMGGVTQILFGIKGRRWEELYADSTAKLFNEHWIRPLQVETPAQKERVENGCYW